MVRNTQPRTVLQAAQELNVSAHTIRAWVAQRRIGHVRLGRSIRIPTAAIEQLLEQGSMPAKKRWERS